MLGEENPVFVSPGKAMRDDLEQTLFVTFPDLFSGTYPDPVASAMGRGFECGEGWFPLLMGLCHSVSQAVQNTEMPKVRVLQVKEKFGRLRFRFSGGNSMTIGMVRMVEDLSMNIDSDTGEWLTIAGEVGVRT